MDFAVQQQTAGGQYAQNGVPPDASLNWVPPPGWVAPPGWAEYQHFLESQKRASQQYAYSPVMMPPPAGAGEGSLPPGTAGQHPIPQMYPGYPPYPQYGYMPHPQSHPQQATGGAGQFVQPGAAQGVANQMQPGQPVPYGYPPYPYGYHPQFYTTVPHPAHGTAGQVYGVQGQQPTTNHVTPSPQPEMLPSTIKPTSSARPAPPEPKTSRQPRVRVEFEDADSDDEKLERHDTLGMFDLSDIHEISERDFAELDDGEEEGVQDAGIIEGGIAVQPAIPLKDTTSRQSTSVPVQSIAVSDIEAAMKEESVSEADDESGDDEKATAKKVNVHVGSFLSPPPLPPSRGNSLMSNVASASSPQIVASPPLPPSRTNSAMPNTIDTSGTNSDSDAATTPQKRRSTFGALLGAAAAVLSGSNRKLSVKGSQVMKPSELGTAEGTGAATAGMGAALMETHSRPAAVSTIEERDGESRASKTNDEELTSKSTEVAEGTSPETAAVGTGLPERDLESATDLIKNQANSANTNTSTSQANLVASPSPAESNIVQIKVRTLAGKAAIFEVDKQMTMFEFRELIMAHFTNIPFDEQRLLYKGKMIEILTPDTLLEDVGFGNGDLVHLVRTVGNKPKSEDSPDINGQSVQQPPPLPLKPPQSAGTNSSISLTSAPEDASHQQQAAIGSPSQQALQMLTVLVPPGRGPGDRLRILPNGRGPMLVTVPQGVFAGDRFRVLLPPEDPVEMRRAQELLQAENQRQQDLIKQQELARQQQHASRPQIMAVVVPKGYKAGQVMDVNVPGKGRVRVTIPSGVKAGQQFKFRLPS